jgi:opacity protein-like surface antigen
VGLNDIHTAFGFYIGAGADVAIGSNLLRLTAEYKWSRASFSGLNSSYLALCAGIRL